MTSPYLAGDLEVFEAFRDVAYPDPDSPLAVAMREGRPTAGLSGAPWTVAFGHTGRDVHPGLVVTRAQGLTLLAGDIAATCRGLDTALPWWRTLDDLRQDCPVNMAFNMGVHGLLGFTSFLHLMQTGQYAAAADDLHGTAWDKQVGVRAQCVEAQIRTGVHQKPL